MSELPCRAGALLRIRRAAASWAAAISIGAATSATVACYPTTTRPPYFPMPTAPVSELQLSIAAATQAVAVALDSDSIPVARTEPKDGWLETGWFDVATGHPTKRRPLGPEVVKVRAWIDPSRPGYSNVTVETVFRPVADPSRSDRDLEQQAGASNPVAGRVVLLLGRLAKVYGGAVEEPVKSDSLGKKKPVPRDSTGTPIKPPIKP